ncbi:uncharacterized protein [Lepisosteus oculatus]|uniref:uncharacterized protein isoform X1 n=1 Tax=Lepisosteus oculatus TaxID=7918 RepID=UPI00371D2F5F
MLCCLSQSDVTMPDEMYYSTVKFTANSCPRTRVTPEEVTYEEVKVEGSQSAQTVPPPGPAVSMSTMRSEHGPPSYRRTAVCQGLLCAVLLVTVIAQFVYYNVSCSRGEKYSSRPQNDSMLNEKLNKPKMNYSTGHQMQNSTNLLAQFFQKFPILDQYCPIDDHKVHERRCQPCPQNWMQNQGKCYHLYQDKMDWIASQYYCRSQGAHLVTIDSDKEQDFIWSKVRTLKDLVWIGLRDINSDKNWHWVNGSPLKNESFWGDKQPNIRNKIPRCVVINPEANSMKNWDDKTCSSSHYWICEADVLRFTPQESAV